MVGGIIVTQRTNVLLNNEAKVGRSLEQYLTWWDENYKKCVSQIPLFDPQKTAQWSSAQREYFVKTFYHVRGHFHSFLWFMGNIAPNKEAKQMIVQNIMEEFGENGLSHERLYYEFAKSLSVDLSNEITKHQYYLPFIQEFNRGHLEWLQNHDWAGCLSAFSAYEKLDNVDYVSLLDLAKSLDISRLGLTFFQVHVHVKHFDNTLDLLSNIWATNPEKVKNGFDFIQNHQLNMWQQLSENVFNYH